MSRHNISTRQSRQTRLPTCLLPMLRCDLQRGRGNTDFACKHVSHCAARLMRVSDGKLCLAFLVDGWDNDAGSLESWVIPGEEIIGLAIRVLFRVCEFLQQLKTRAFVIH